MNVTEAIQIIEKRLYTQTGKKLTMYEKEIIKAAWNKQNYSQLAEDIYLTEQYIKKIAADLWKMLSELLGAKVSKSQLRSLLENGQHGEQNQSDSLSISPQINNEELKQHQERIMIVDDATENLQLLEKIVASLGHKPIFINHGSFAVKSALYQPPSLILLDIKMPNMDGYEVCQALKADKKTADIPIIFLSCLDDVIDKVKAFKCGGIDYITKPFEEEEVIVRIENQLTIHRQKRQLQEKIEKLREANESVYQSRALLVSIINASSEGIAAMSALRSLSTGEIEDFQCLTVNPAFAQVFNAKRQDMPDRISMKEKLEWLAPGLFKRLVKVVETGELLSEIVSTQQKYLLNAIKLGEGVSLTLQVFEEPSHLSHRLSGKSRKRGKRLGGKIEPSASSPTP